MQEQFTSVRIKTTKHRRIKANAALVGVPLDVYLDTLLDRVIKEDIKQNNEQFEKVPA